MRPLYLSSALAQATPPTPSTDWTPPPTQSMFSEPSVTISPLYSAPMRTPLSIGLLDEHCTNGKLPFLPLDKARQQWRMVYTCHSGKAHRQKTLKRTSVTKQYSTRGPIFYHLDRNTPFLHLYEFLPLSPLVPLLVFPCHRPPDTRPARPVPSNEHQLETALRLDATSYPRSHRWLRVVTTMVSNLTLAKIAAVGGVVTITTGYYIRGKIEEGIKKSEYYKEALKTFRNHKGVVSLFGEPIKDGHLNLGDSKNNFCDSYRAQFEVPVRGPHHKGTLHLWAERETHQHNWNVYKLELEVQGNSNKRIVLRDQPSQTSDS
uniref:Uncharacterized protein n=1 Tax=Timema shepardi TaxID=629360 RepID=A0A7R9B7N8_TIMSH|nr:unnamed protein product [Timema shepardi]